MLAGEASSADFTYLTSLATLMQEASLCGLGMSVHKPVLSALKHFPELFSRNSPPARRGAD
jgi:NADH:ubiquinone oxidoreductase subunit F (NADH-binding)